MTARPGRRYALDHWARRTDGGRVLLGGAPGRLVRLTEAGARALDQMLSGSASASVTPLRNRLCAHGILHPVAEAALRSATPVSFVVPNRNGGERLATLVARLRGWGLVIVVDDGSSDSSPALAARAGATVIANSRAPGPAGARNAGLAAASSEYVAFVDADCICAEEWAAPLAALLDEEPELAIAAPRVRSSPGHSAIAAYERGFSPLDMGPHPGMCGPGHRVAYVPSAAVVVRRRALLELGGFDEDLRFGEDVDLCLRLGAEGWAVRYAPEVTVEHRPRSTLRDFAAQRFHYGSSAAKIDRRHPGRVAPLLFHRHSAGLLAAAVIGATRSPRCSAAAAAVAFAASTVLVASKGNSAPVARALALLALQGNAIAARGLARALVRDWLPLTVTAALHSSRGRRIAAAALAVDSVASCHCNRGARDLALRQLDHVAYCAGLWVGLARERNVHGILPARLR